MKKFNLISVILSSVILALFWSGSLSDDIWNYGYLQLAMGQLAAASLIVSLINLLKN
jgi:hypothetical protein